MDSLKPSQWAGAILAVVIGIYLLYTRLQYFGDVSFLGGVVMLEIVVAAIWSFERRFMTLLLITFLWAGMHVPLQSAGTIGRWVVLFAGASVGFVMWMKSPRMPFRTIHLVAFFCICTALVSATVSSFVQTAALKAFSLALLFLYCSSGARLAVIGREERFFPGLILACEIAVYITAVCYFALGDAIWGNPNSLGAVMSICAFPILMWGWMISESPLLRNRRGFALLICIYLVRMSLSRAAMITVVAEAVVFCVGLHRYKLLYKMTFLVIFMVAVGALVAPKSLNTQITDFKDAILYKGHKDEGVMGSRRAPWDESIASIKEHPWFGTGYGTSPIGTEPVDYSPTMRSSAETEREHGSSYINIAEWVGLLGIVPFVVLLAMTLAKMCKVFVLMHRTGNVRFYSIPLAMVVFGGLMHASFEDWLFAVGSYLAAYFWICAFLLADLAPEGDILPALSPAPRFARPLPAEYGVVVSNQ